MRHFPRAWLGIFRVACAFACIGTSAYKLDAAEPDENVVESFDFAGHPEDLLVPVALGNQRLQFLIDTGCSVAVIDSEFKSLLRPVPGSVTINTRSGKRSYRLHDAFVGRTRLPMAGMAVSVDLSQLREASGCDIRGVLGMSFLKSRVVHIDFDAKTFSILKNAPPSTGTGLRMTLDKHDMPLVFIEVTPGEGTAFIVDTGKSGSSLSLRRFKFDELVENSRLELIGPGSLVATVEGNVRLRDGRLDQFNIGEFQHKNVKLCEGESNLIGIDLLSRYTVTFDFPNERLYLKPGRRFKEPDQFGWCGMPIGRIDGKTRIKEVSKDSVAEAAGLKEGDEIMRIDGKGASSLSLSEIRRILKTGGRQIRLEVEGPDSRRDVEIRVSGPVVD